MLSVAGVFLSPDKLATPAAGYLAGAVLVPTFTIIFRFSRRKAAQNPFFVPRIAQERLALIVLILGIAAGAGNAWLLATELAKR